MRDAVEVTFHLEYYIAWLMGDPEEAPKPRYKVGQVVRLLPERLNAHGIATGTAVGIVERVPTFEPSHVWGRRALYGVRVHFGDGCPPQLLSFYEPELLPA